MTKKKYELNIYTFFYSDDVCVLSATGTAAVVNLMPSVNSVGYFSGIYPSAPLTDIPEPLTSNTYVSINLPLRYIVYIKINN